MNTETIEIVQQEYIALVNKLTKLLEEQINILQCSDVYGRKVEALAIHIQSIVNEIASKGLLDLEQFRAQREHIKRLYENLSLALISQRDETSKQVNQIRKGKKTLGTYRSNI